jgi:hypothetical protein
MSERLAVRFSDRLWSAIEARSVAEGITPASWVRKAVERVLGETTASQADSKADHPANHTYKPALCPRCGTNDNARRFVEPLAGGGRGPCQHSIHAENDDACLFSVDPKLWRSLHSRKTTPVDPLQPRSGVQSPRAHSDAAREALVNWTSKQRR